MKVLKAQGNYLRKNATRNSIIGSMFLIGFLILLLSSFYTSFYTPLGIFSLFLSLISLIVGMGFFRKSMFYSRGIQGEEEVGRALSALDDSYTLINDVNLSDGYGNIDHIVLAPNGVFVIETKNYCGVIVCVGDRWLRHYPGAFRRRNFDLGSPSKQVKRNALRVKKFIESLEPFRNINIWVDGVVVFANPKVQLHLKGPTVPILRSNELPNYILTRKLNYNLSSPEIEQIGRAILRQTL